MVAVQDITAKDWSPKLHGFGEVLTGKADIAQCIKVICATPFGAVPLRPEFGSEIFRWLDAPLDVAQVNIPLTLFASIERWEPRVVLDSVQVLQGAGIAELVIVVNWRVVQTNETQTLTLTTTDLATTPLTALEQETVSQTVARIVDATTMNPNDFMRKDEFAAGTGIVKAARKLRDTAPNNTEYETSFENDGRITTTTTQE